MKPNTTRLIFLFFLITWLLTTPGCASRPDQNQLADELVFYNWPEYMPQSVLDAFSTEYGVKVKYLTYDSAEEAVEELRAGKQVDIVVLDHDYILPLAAEGLLAEIDYHHLPNFKNILASFRDLGFDPGNRHSVPYSYGTTGLVVRTDLLKAPVTRWADLWDPRYAGRIAIRNQPTEMIGVTLKSLGYPLNSEDPQQLEAALQRLLALEPILLGDATGQAVQILLSGQAVMMVGWGNDALQAREENPAIAYILPDEGTLLWSDTYVIPANSPNKFTAEVFINFVLRPEISAQIVNDTWEANANQAAYPFILPEILNDPIIFPPGDVIRKADWYMTLSPAGEKLYADLWERFLAGGP